MPEENVPELKSLLKILPSVEFACVYGSSLHPNSRNKVFQSTMLDYILGVKDPLQWHGENLKMNRDHYASCILRLGGANLITKVADNIGVGVHFNPYVAWNDKMFKYGVVRSNDLIKDITNWQRFYLSGRLQKPVQILVDELNLKNVNLVNLRAAIAAAMLLLPPKFIEEDLYAKICSLSYMGDVRMLFAEDRNKVKKIVQGQFGSFQSIYKPILEEYEARDLLTFSSFGGHNTSITQDYSLSSARCLVASLPLNIRNLMGMKLGENRILNQSVSSREEVVKCMQKVVRRKVMGSSARQAVSGLLAVGGFNAAKYVSSKVSKARKSWMN